MKICLLYIAVANHEKTTYHIELRMKYRVKPIDLMRDIWVIQERVFFIFWKPRGFGQEAEVKRKAAKMNDVEK